MRQAFLFALTRLAGNVAAWRKALSSHPSTNSWSATSLRGTAIHPRMDRPGIGSKSLDELNRNSPLKPVFYPLDSSDVDSGGQATLQANADVLKKYMSWQITIEGHCDERGTAEYNLALGERRAVSARTYLLSLGIAADRIKTVSYGKEFPFDPGHDEGAWSKNRRAHFVVTGK